MVYKISNYYQRHPKRGMISYTCLGMFECASKAHLIELKRSGQEQVVIINFACGGR